MRNVLPRHFGYEVESKAIALKKRSSTKAFLMFIDLLKEFHSYKSYGKSLEK